MKLKDTLRNIIREEVEDMSSKFWVVAKDKRGALYVFNDGYYNTKEEAEEALKNITVPKIVDANTIKVEPVPTSPNYTVLYDNLSEGSLEEKLNESIKHFKNPVNVAKLSLKDTLDLQRTAKIITESQYKKLLKEDAAEDIKIGKLYLAQMPTSNDGEERVDVKVKVLAPAKELSPEHFVVEILEDKDYVNPVSKQQNRYKKGDHNNIEAKYLSPL
jgi:hypothetical protein